MSGQRVPPRWARDDTARQLEDATHAQPDRGRHFLEADIALERERVAQEQHDRREAVQRLRAYAAPVLRATDVDLPPDGVVPLHETPRPDGLAVDTSIGSYALKRLSPFRDRWPEVLEFDERVARLEQRQTDLNAQITAAQQQIVPAEAADREALARWAADKAATVLPRPCRGSSSGSRTSPRNVTCSRSRRTMFSTRRPRSSRSIGTGSSARP